MTDYIPEGEITGTTPPPEPVPVEPAPEPVPVEAAPGPAPGEAPPEPPPQEAAPEEYPPADASGVTYRDAEQEAALAPAREQYGNAPATSEAEAGYVPEGEPAPDTGEVITTEGSTRGDLSGEPIETPVAAVSPEPGLSYAAPVGDEATGQDLRSQNPDATFEPTAAVPPPSGAGPLQDAANALGQLIAPATEQLPEPVQNLTDIVGQPVGGAIDATQEIANQLGEGDIPGAIGAGLGALSGPWSRGVEQVGTNIAAGEPAVATPDQILQDPGQALTWLPGLASRYGPAPAVTGVTEEDWFNSLPPDQQASLAAQGGVAMNQAWLESIGSSPVPPPEMSNPFDAATSGNPLERLGQVAGAIPQMAGGVFQSGRQGTLGPFLLSQAQNIVEDPLTFIPGAATERLAGRVGEAAGRLPGAERLGALTDYTPAEQARLAGEHLATATEEYTRAGINQLPAAGWPPEGNPLAPRPDAVRPADMGPIRGYHASNTTGLDTISATPAMRANLDAKSTLGAYFSPERDMTRGFGTHIYEADVPLKNPFRMDAQEFNRQVGGAEPATAEALQRAAAFRQSLVDQGYDGIITTRNGQPAEIISFNDVPIAAREMANQQRRNAVGVAYDAAPPAFKQAVSQTMPPDPHFHRGVIASKDTIDLMKEPANGRYKFRNGWKPDKMTGADVVAKVNEDTHSWLRGFDRQGQRLPWTEGTDPRAKAWRNIDAYQNPHGDIDPRPMMAGLDVPGARVSAAQRRADHVVSVLTDAIQGGLPPSKQGKAMGAFGQWTNAIRQSMLFNVLNVPRYIAQNLSTNTINITVRGGGLRPAIDVWTNVKEMGRIYGNIKDGSPTTLNSVIKHTGMGDIPNIQQSPRAYFDRITGEPPKWLKIPTDIIAPEFGRFIASVPDQFGREAVGMQAILDGYHELNKTLVPTAYDQFRHQTPTQLPPLEKFRQVVTDFLQENRTIPDAKTGETLTGLLGQADRYESMWNPDALRDHLKEHLYEDMPANQRPYPGQINRAVNDLTGMMHDEVRKIGQAAGAKTDYALFPWRNTVADEGLSNVTLFHYYMSRQGGFYLSEMAKHPWVASAYGRMMAEMQEQNEALGGPMWMTGWFQLQQSVGGFSTWFSPTDFVASLLTMAEWQMPDDPSKYEDLTRVGQAMQQFPFMVHPLIQGVAYGAGILGPDARTPNLTGTETFGAKFIQLLNLGNSEGAPFMKPFNAMGIGVDAQGNPIPIAPRPLQDLYGTVGHAISAALMPITGLPPVEAKPSWGNFMADVQAIGEQETRKAHPEWDNGTTEGELQISDHVTSVLQDAGSLEYQNWYKLAASEPFQLGEGTNPVLAAAARIASPIQIRTSPEQRVLDQRKGALEESGNAPMRTLDDGLTDDTFLTAKGMISKTVEGRQLEQEASEYENLLPAGLDDARDVLRNISYQDFTEGQSPEIGGEVYTNERLAEMSYTERAALQTQYLLEHNLSDEDNQMGYDAQQEYLADHPQLAQYNAYKSLIGQQEGATQDEKAGAFAEQMRLSNPSFSQFYESNIIDHITGMPDYGAVWGTDAFLASQGIRGSQYSPIAGNEPSTAPGGYPAIPGTDPTQPLLPGVGLTNTVDKTFVYPKPSDVYYTTDYDTGEDTAIGILDPSLPIQTLGAPQRAASSPDSKAYNTWVVKVAQNDVPIGYVDASLVGSTAPVRPEGTATVPQPSGGLAALGGQASDAIGNAVGGLASGGLGAVGGGLGAVGDAIGGAIPQGGPAPPAPAPVAAPQEAAPVSGGGMVKDTPPEYAPLIQQAADDNGVPASILSALLNQESRFDPNALSPAGAQGIAQFMPDTADGLGIDPYDPDQAIPAAAQYLKAQYDQFGSWDLALAAYNAGAGNVEKYGGIPPFEETQNYVSVITKESRKAERQAPPVALTPTSEPQPAAAPGQSLGDVLGGAAQGVLGALGGAKDAVFGGSQAAPAAPPVDTGSGVPWQFSRPAGTYDHAAIDGINTKKYVGQSNPRETVTDDEGNAIPNVQGIVYHFTAGSSIDEFSADFTGQTGRKASSNYVVDKDGKIYQFVDPSVGAAWANGDDNNPDARAQFLLDAGGGDANQSTVSIEIVNEGDKDHPGTNDPANYAPYTPEQLEAVQNLTNYLAWKYRIPADDQHLVGHSDINTVGKRDPGPLFPMDAIIANAANPEMTAPKNPVPLASGGYTPEMRAQITGPVAPPR